MLTTQTIKATRPGPQGLYAPSHGLLYALVLNPWEGADKP